MIIVITKVVETPIPGYIVYTAPLSHKYKSRSTPSTGTALVGSKFMLSECWYCAAVARSCSALSFRYSVWRAVYAWLKMSFLCCDSVRSSSRSLMRWSFLSLYALCEARFWALRRWSPSQQLICSNTQTHLETHTDMYVCIYIYIHLYLGRHHGERVGLTDKTEGGAFLYLFSRFRFGFCAASCEVSDGVDSADISPCSKLESMPGYDIYWDNTD